MSLAVTLVAAASLFGVVEQNETRSPAAWRALTGKESAAFDLGHAVFNTQWTPANAPAGRRDGLGPRFNAPSCDACHNSGRRGRGPSDAGQAPIDLVIQLGERQADGSVARGTKRFGFIINTAANGGLQPEAVVSIRYEAFRRELPDGTSIGLRRPEYEVSPVEGQPLAANTVLMPRMPQAVHGAGLLERVRESDVIALSRDTTYEAIGVRGRVPWIGQSGRRTLGRFGWQATEPLVSTQVASAFSREMGLTSPLDSRVDCGEQTPACLSRSGGDPEVEDSLFSAVVLFQKLQAVPRTAAAWTLFETSHDGRALFESAGCIACHRAALTIGPERSTAPGGDEDSRVIVPFTDMLLHDLGPELADRDAAGTIVPSEWRTAPLWGLNAAFATGRPVRLMHDGRARSVEEAIAWHGGTAAESRRRFEHLPKSDRDTLVEWVRSL